MRLLKTSLLVVLSCAVISVSSARAGNWNNQSSESIKILKDFMVGDAKALVPSRRNASSSGIVQRLIIDDEEFAEISLSYEDEGGNSDWNRTGERNQRWELRDKKLRYKLNQPYFLTYRFRIQVGEDHQGSGSDKYFQIIAANRDRGAWNPVAQLKNEGGYLTFTFYLNYEVFYLCGENNSNMKHRATRFKLARMEDLAGTVNQIDLKFLPSKGHDGELILLFNDKTVITHNGINTTLSYGILHKFGLYRVDINADTPDSSILISRFGTSKKCEDIISKNKCDLLTAEVKRTSTSVPWENYAHMASDFGKKICKRAKTKPINFFSLADTKPPPVTVDFSVSTKEVCELAIEEWNSIPGSWSNHAEARGLSPESCRLFLK